MTLRSIRGSLVCVYGLVYETSGFGTQEFFRAHGLGLRVVGLRVYDFGSGVYGVGFEDLGSRA